MPKQPPTLGTIDQSGIPRIGRDEPSMGDLIVWQIIDSHTFMGGKRPQYGDAYPGLVSSNDGSTLYSNFVCIDCQPTEDNRYWNVAWQGLPGTMLYERQMSDQAQGAFVTLRRQIVATGTAQQGLTPNTIGYDDKEIDPGRTLRTSTIADAFPVKYEYLYDNERGNVIRSRQLIPITGSESATDILSGTTAIKTFYQPYEQNLLLNWKIIEAFEVPGPLLSGAVLDPGAQMSQCTEYRQIVAYNAGDLTPDVDTLSWRDEPIDSITKRRVYVLATEFPILYDYYYDRARSGGLVTVGYQVVDSSTTLPVDTVGTVNQLKHLDEWRSLLIISVYSAPPDLEEFRFGAQNMPGLFRVEDYSWTDACGAYQVNGYRPTQSMMTRIKTLTEWSGSRPSRRSCFTARPVSKQIGQGWQGWQGVLINEYTLPITCGGSSFDVDIEASDPDYDTYVDTIAGDPHSSTATYQLIAEESVWDGEINNWKRTSLYVEMI